MSLPSDLVPLPTAPYDQRPDSMPLNIQECRTALWRASGNITTAATLLKVPSNRLRNFVVKSPFLSAEHKEAQERLVDKAEDVIYNALNDSADTGRQDTMARFVATNLGRHRGYGTGSPGISINAPKGRINISWGDGSAIVGGSNDDENDLRTIEGSVNQ